MPLDTGSSPVPQAGELPLALDLLRGARLADGSQVDLRLDGDVVVETAPVGTLHPHDPAATLDLDGWLLLSAPAEPHAHLDKALSFDLIQAPFGDLRSAVDAWVAYAATLSVSDIVERARAQALAMLANGITAIRTHADVHAGFATRSAQALVEVRDELADLMDIEIVALVSRLATREDIDAALDLGLDLVGGAPHMAEDPTAEVDRLVAVAAERGLGLDLHTDENLDGPLTLDHFARCVRHLPRERGDHAPRSQERAARPSARRTYAASHCVRLGTLAPAHRDAVIAEVAASDLGIVSLPITNLYLQGWAHPQLTPRGLTALRALLDAGVRVAAGADNVRDPFNPVGRSCAFETASLLVSAGHLSPQEAWHLVSDGARDVMGLPEAGPRPGARAELLAIRAENLTQAVAEGPPDRLVIHRGRLVARTECQRSVAASRPPVPTGAR